VAWNVETLDLDPRQPPSVLGMGTSRDGLMSVGQVARSAGLTTKALRHYDRLGLLTPREVSADGYRWYDPAQVAHARTIARLRGLGLPLAVVRAILDDADDGAVRRLLTEHRATWQARDDRIRRALHHLNHLIDDPGGLTMSLNAPAKEPVTDERGLAVQLFNDVWSLLEREGRSAEEDDRMLHMVHASRFHWDNVGDDQNRAVGEWQCARVYATLGRGEAAVFHARRCLAYAEHPGVDDWVAASGYEALARAQAAAGDVDAARDARGQALQLLDRVGDPEDRAIVAADLDTLPFD